MHIPNGPLDLAPITTTIAADSAVPIDQTRRIIALGYEYLVAKGLVADPTVDTRWPITRSPTPHADFAWLATQAERFIGVDEATTRTVLTRFTSILLADGVLIDRHVEVRQWDWITDLNYDRWIVPTLEDLDGWELIRTDATPPTVVPLEQTIFQHPSGKKKYGWSVDRDSGYELRRPGHSPVAL